MIYTADTIRNHPDIRLTRGGLILFALLSGGDYDTNGVTNFGQKTAYGLARCGFGDELLNIFHLRGQGGDIAPLLAAWRAAVNVSFSAPFPLTFMTRRRTRFARTLRASFPRVPPLYPCRPPSPTCRS